MIEIHGIPAYTDNYIWCIWDKSSKKAIVIDPGSFDATEDYLQKHGLSLIAILVTHHHPDHTGGIKKLKDKYACKCIASDESKVSLVEDKLKESAQVSLLGLDFTCINLPGHTLDHNAYYCEQLNALFCGDTLFSAGCGRLFEGSAEQMHHSLKKIADLPLNTRIFCAHEYTLSNIDFAMSLMPDNHDLVDYQNKATELRSKGLSTVPTSLEHELRINPFLRSHDKDLIESLEKQFCQVLEDELAVFAATRLAKDNY